ncbi:YoaK family protein [Frankia sp. AgKG'84/4]|uniref:YoaK family protein n=1 Tax=Frankia sp. AgKG'84/4 TaxID=573490 RepID=UPI0020102955|nr:YoaK family protein [Frankia sp. AgKG'84/4]MCL9793199.1 DUF1275 domain-containing protein [Frankia sp. AgKG'84/4]
MGESISVTTSGDRGRRRMGLLLTMAAMTGLVDSTSYLGLDRVFVANMTGNVVLLAFALAGAPGLSADLSALALAGFLAGATLAGRIASAPALSGLAHGVGRAHRWLLVALTAEATLICLALLAAVVTGQVGEPRPYGVVAPLAVAMGLQHATARRVAMPEVPTNVLTTTLTGLVIDSRLAGGPGFHAPSRLAAPVAMFSGALVGGACLLHIGRLVPLSLAVALGIGCLLAVVTGLVAAEE